MSEEKIKVISAIDGRCGIDNADLHISRRWPARGSVVTFTRQQIEELMFDPAFSNMVREGVLYIEDMEVKKEIGIEPEDATAPTIILMDEKQLKNSSKTLRKQEGNTNMKKKSVREDLKEIKEELAKENKTSSKSKDLSKNTKQAPNKTKKEKSR